jgi:hypothetical protein
VKGDENREKQKLRNKCQIVDRTERGEVPSCFYDMPSSPDSKYNDMSKQSRSEAHNTTQKQSGTSLLYILPTQ